MSAKEKESMKDGSFPERLEILVPRGLVHALAVLAGRQYTTRSEVARQALLRTLELNGVKLSDRQVPV
jgi:hypothetical protein